MSLSFVSSAVLSSSDGVSHNEERQIESKETKAIRGQAKSHTPLFEQLRTNKEEDEAKREEFQRSIMRGTLALDEEDVAHLDSINKQKKDRDDAVQESVEQELALFRAARAARADRNHSQLVAVDDEQEEEDDTKLEAAVVSAPSLSTSQNAPSTAAPLMPKIVVKKKRRRRQQEDQTDSDAPEKAEKKQKTEGSSDAPDNSSSKQEDAEEESGLGGLLGGYGSSDSD